MTLLILKGEIPTSGVAYQKDHLIAIVIMSFIYLNVDDVNIAFLMKAALKLSLDTE